MSVKQHEPMCLDSAQDHFWWMDHFLGDQIQDEWRDVGTGSAAVVDQQTGGICRITTGALNGNSHRIDWQAIRSLRVLNRVTFEARLKLSHDTYISFQVGLLADVNNSITFYINETGGTPDNFLLRNEDGGLTTSVDSGVTQDTDYHIFRIESHLHGASHIHYYIDGVECNNSPVTTNVPDDANDYLQPYLNVTARENLAKYMDVDYCAVRQDR